MNRTEEFCHTKNFYALLKMLIIDPHHQAAGNLGMSLTINYSFWPGMRYLCNLRIPWDFSLLLRAKILLKQKYFPARKSLFSAGSHKEMSSTYWG